MQKKVFLRKGGGPAGGGRPNYVKYLLFAILGLSLAVVGASYLLNPKGREAKKTLPEKPLVKKELPKPPESAPEETPGGLAGKPQTTPEPPGQTSQAPRVEPPQPQMQPQPPAAQLAQPVQPVQPQPQEPAQTARPQEGPRDLFPKSPGSPALTLKAPPLFPTRPQENKEKKEAAHKPEKPTAAPVETAKQAHPEKPSAAPASAKKAVAGGSFAVQVGCYKEKKSAEETVQKLRAKGFDVELCPSGPGGSYGYTVKSRPVASLSKASTLSEQLKTQKFNPTVLKGAAACGLDEPAIKAQMKKPAAAKKAPAVKKTAVKPQSAKKPAATVAKTTKPAANAAGVSAANGNGKTATSKPAATVTPAAKAKTTAAAAKPAASPASKPKATPASAEESD